MYKSPVIWPEFKKTLSYYLEIFLVNVVFTWSELFFNIFFYLILLTIHLYMVIPLFKILLLRRPWLVPKEILYRVSLFYIKE